MEGGNERDIEMPKRRWRERKGVKMGKERKWKV